MDETNPNNKRTIDSVKPEKRSIRNIPLSKKQTQELETIEEREESGGPAIPPPVEPRPARPTRSTNSVRTRKTDEEEAGNDDKRGGGAKWWVIGILCLVLIYGIAHYFKKATVSIVRAEETVVLSGNTFTLVPLTATSTEIGIGTIAYQKSIFNLVASTTISASGEQKVTKKASGKVVIYNDSTSAQLLIATTRLQTPEGLIFRINSNVTVPAKKNVTVDVTADQAGTNYNIGPKTFSLPGLKGTTKEKTVYGKSSASMSGGTVSTVAQTSSSDLSSAKAALQNGIKNEAITKAISELPEGYVFVESGMVITYDDVKQTYSNTDKTANLSQTAAVAIYYLEKSSYSSAIASRSELFSFATSSLYVDADTVSIVASIPEVKAPESLTLTGTSTVKAAFNQDQIGGAVAGLSKNDALSALKALPGIEMVEISIQPWWERKLPSKQAVKVEIE